MIEVFKCDAVNKVSKGKTKSVPALPRLLNLEETVDKINDDYAELYINKDIKLDQYIGLVTKHEAYRDSK